MIRFLVPALLLLAAPAAAVAPLGAAPEQTVQTGHIHFAAPAEAELLPAPTVDDVLQGPAPGAARSALPDMSTWMAMIAGFAMIGFAARWRRLPRREEA